MKFWKLKYNLLQKNYFI